MNPSPFRPLFTSTLGSPAPRRSNTRTFKHGHQWIIMDPLPGVPRILRSTRIVLQGTGSLCRGPVPLRTELDLVCAAGGFALLTARPVAGLEKTSETSLPNSPSAPTLKMRKSRPRKEKGCWPGSHSKSAAEPGPVSTLFDLQAPWFSRQLPRRALRQSVWKISFLF